MARGKRPATFRTRKLSLSAPMVLPWRRGGRVGRRRTTIPEGPQHTLGPFVLSRGTGQGSSPPARLLRRRPDVVVEPHVQGSQVAPRVAHLVQGATGVQPVRRLPRAARVERLAL